jgi:hypothetical protein
VALGEVDEMPSKNGVTIQFLAAFADAWNRHDTDAILAMMTQVCVMQMPAGPDIGGTSYTGHDEIRSGIKKVFSTIPNARWNDTKHFVAEDRGVTEWVLTGLGPNGPIGAQGCDLFTFRDGKIAFKNSYRKQRTG